MSAAARKIKQTAGRSPIL
jgi:hypothetical protein